MNCRMCSSYGFQGPEIRLPACLNALRFHLVVCISSVRLRSSWHDDHLQHFLRAIDPWRVFLDASGYSYRCGLSLVIPGYHVDTLYAGRSRVWDDKWARYLPLSLRRTFNLGLRAWTSYRSSPKLCFEIAVGMSYRRFESVL